MNIWTGNSSPDFAAEKVQIERMDAVLKRELHMINGGNLCTLWMPNHDVDDQVDCAIF